MIKAAIDLIKVLDTLIKIINIILILLSGLLIAFLVSNLGLLRIMDLSRFSTWSFSYFI